VSTEIPVSHGYDQEEDDWLAIQQRSLIDEESLRSAFATTFATPQGEMVLAYLYDFCRIGLPTYESGDSHQTAFNEGKRRVMLQIMGFIELEHEDLFRRARGFALARQGE